jgi:hypothetical protein
MKWGLIRENPFPGSTVDYIIKIRWDPNSQYQKGLWNTRTAAFFCKVGYSDYDVP